MSLKKIFGCLECGVRFSPFEVNHLLETGRKFEHEGEALRVMEPACPYCLDRGLEVPAFEVISLHSAIRLLFLRIRNWIVGAPGVSVFLDTRSFPVRLYYRIKITIAPVFSGLSGLQNSPERRLELFEAGRVLLIRPDTAAEEKLFDFPSELEISERRTAGNMPRVFTAMPAGSGFDYFPVTFTDDYLREQFA